MKAFINKDRSIRKTVIFVNLCIVFPLILTFLLLLFTMVQESADNNNQTKLQSLVEKANSVQFANTEVIKIIASFMIDTDINKILSTLEYDNEYQQVVDKREIEEECLSLTSMYTNDWYQIMIFAENGETYCDNSAVTGLEEVSISDLAAEDWYQTLVEDDNRVRFFPQNESDILGEFVTGDAVYAAGVIKNSNSARPIAVIVVAMAEEMFVEDLLQFDLSTEYSILTDKDGNIIYASDDSIYEMDMTAEAGFATVFAEDQGYYTDSINSVTSEIRFVTVADTQWKLITYNDREYVWTMYLLGTVVLGIVLLIVVTLMVQYNCNFIYRKIRGINDHILVVTSGDLHAKLKIEEYESEFQELCENFNEMLTAVQILVEQLHEEEKVKYQLEFQTLQAQINPHFLYNTLTTIRFMIEMEQYDEANCATATFSKLLSKSFRDTRSVIPIQEELELVGDYMDLMQIRHHHSFDWEIDIDPVVKNYGIMKNSIQPLVENSISHGFSTKQTQGHVLITAKQVDDLVQIQVIDDGENADFEKIQQQLQSETPDPTVSRLSGIGVVNVQQRIKRNFGQQFGMTAQINEQGGVTTTMIFPITFI